MGKIKLNLPTGASVEKSLINSFKVDNIIYAVFDAASVGSMGLPIILVSKYDNNRLIKIVEQEEWTKVKGYLKEIISGVKKDFVNLESTLDADEVYYTQLTLPVASFDILKKVYDESLNNLNSQITLDSTNLVSDIPIQSNELVTMENNAPVTMENSNETNDPVVPTQSIPEPINNNLENSLVDNNVNNVIDGSKDLVISSVSENDNLKVETPVIPNNDVAVNPLLNDNSLPASDSVEVQTSNDNLNTNLINDLPLDENVSTLNNVTMSTRLDDDLSSEKEEFLKFCGEFFDKMIEKIKNN